MSKIHRFERFAQFVRTFSSKGSNLTFLAVGSTVCKGRYWELFGSDILKAPPTPLSLCAPPLRMQRGRYSFCGIHPAAIHKHAVVGRRLHHADNDDARGFILHRYSPSCPSDYTSKTRRAHQSPSGTRGIPGRTRNQRACVLAYGGTTTFCSHRVYFSP